MNAKKLLIIFIILISFYLQLPAMDFQFNKELTFTNFLCNYSYNENTLINTRIINYELSNDKKIVSLKKIGLSGIIVSFCGTALFIPGIILLAVSYTKNGIHFTNFNRLDNFNLSETEKQEARGIFISGVILFCVGIPTIVIGLSLLITGYIFAFYFENKTTVFIKNDGKNILAGYSYKF